MPWNQILGHERIKKILQKSIIDSRIAGSYCFWGISGIGKDALALEFAKTVNCMNPNIDGESIESCGECKSCIQFGKMSNPNVDFVFSLPVGKSETRNDLPLDKLSEEQITAIHEQKLMKAEDPYYRISIQNANHIKISSIREVKRKLMLSGTGRGRRFVIISGADEMNAESANAFLKTLEEPNEGVTIIMTTSRPEMILPTILSRCQQVRCEPLPDDVLMQTLSARFDLPEADAKTITSFAQGSYTRALDFMDEDMRKLRFEVVEMLRTALKKRNFRSELLEYTGSLSKSLDKKGFETMLSLFLLWFRDIMIYQQSGESGVIVNSDQTKIIEKFTAKFGASDHPRAIQSVEEAIIRTRKNVSKELILLTLFLNLRQIFLEKPL